MMASTWARVIGHHRERGRPSARPAGGPAGAGRPLRAQAKPRGGRVASSRPCPVAAGARVSSCWVLENVAGADAARLVTGECPASC